MDRAILTTRFPRPEMASLGPGEGVDWHAWAHPSPDTVAVSQRCYPSSRHQTAQSGPSAPIVLYPGEKDRSALFVPVSCGTASVSKRFNSISGQPTVLSRVPLPNGSIRTIGRDRPLAKGGRTKGHPFSREPPLPNGPIGEARIILFPDEDQWDYLEGGIRVGRLPGAGYSGEVANSPLAGS